MKLSLSIPDEFTITNHGYGVISQQIVLSLQRLGHTVQYRDPSCQVELAIGQPYHWLWSSRDSYKIGLVAWESTVIPDRWKKMLPTCDELWTPSPVIAQWFGDEGYPVSKVYQHGVDGSVWTPKFRKYYDPVKFLHIGEPAPRKGGQMVYDAFRDLFGNDERATLTIKAFGRNGVKGERNLQPDRSLKNVTVIKDEMTEEELVSLVQQHNVLVYPSFGEGFGLIPLQAMATGMPVICTEAWAPYNDLLLPELKLGSTLGRSPWKFHTGKMFVPNKAELREKMQHAFDHIDTLSIRSLARIPDVRREYKWDKRTAEAFDHIVQKFDSKENDAKILI